MSVINATLCNTTISSSLCVPLVPPPPQHDEQERFLGLILGMDPLSVLGRPQLNSTQHIGHYRSAVNLSQVLDMISFLHILTLVSVTDDRGTCVCASSPMYPAQFESLAQRLKREHQRMMTNMIWSTLMPQYYLNQSSEPDAYLLQYLRREWNNFRQMGRQLMTRGWFLPDTWKAYQSFHSHIEFSARIKGVVQLMQMR